VELPSLAYPNVVQWSVPVFVLALVAEVVFTRRARRDWYELSDTAASVSMGVGSLVTGGVGNAAVLGVHLWLYEHRILPIGTQPGWIPLTFVLQDLAFYWKHRFQHQVRWMWAEHVNHHSSQQYNLSTALRQSWTGLLALNWLFYLPLSLLGFHPAMTLFCAGVNLVYQFWIHTQAVGTLPSWFEAIFNAPSHHRVHHAVNPRYLDANYGGTLIVWDRLFGSFVAEHPDDPARYGIVESIDTFNPLRIAFHEWWALARDLARARSLREAFFFVFGPPGWSPDGKRRTTAMIHEAWVLEQAALRREGTE
jgi:sterol desaturase/sphingolipid hydroxylase (fatty acid hydroxylase superfamily)